MSKLIKNKFNLILSIFILFQPILDLITGICIHVFNINLTFGIIIRLLFLLFIIYTTLCIYRKKKALFPYLIIGINSLLYLLGIIIYKDGSNLFQELQGLMRVFYFPILLISLYELKDEIKVSKMTLMITLLIYLVAIFIPIIFNAGFKSYEITKKGTLGFFNSANEISGIISLLTPIMFIVLKDLKSIILKTVITLIYIIVILTVGTKTPLLSLFITICFTILYLFIKCLKNKKYKSLIYSFLLIVIGAVGLIIIIPETNFYKNIQTHLDFLKIDEVTDIVETEEFIDHFIFSQRLTFLKNKDKIYEESSTYEKIFGIGYINNNETTKMIEMDYFDIYYSHGLIGFIIFFSIYIGILFNILKEKQPLYFDRIMYLVSLLLIIFLSLFTGHIITAPAVALISIIIIISLKKNHHRKIIYLTSEKKKSAKIKELLDDQQELIIIASKKTTKIKALLFDYHNYDIALYDEQKDEKLSNLYSKNSYNYNNKIKDLNKLLN